MSFQPSLFSRRLTLVTVTGSLLFIFLLLAIERPDVRAKASSYFQGSTSIPDMVGDVLNRTSSNFSDDGLNTTSSDVSDDVFNRTLGFEKIFLINLPTRTDRQDAVVLSAALSDIDLDLVEGVYGDTVIDKAVPLGPGAMTASEKGCWRSHMNVLEEIIRENISSALILEDDADWDVRIKKQLHDFAISTRTLTQPLLKAASSYADPTFPSPLEPSFQPADIDFEKLPSTIPPKTSPYGDNWDFLWLGHCAMLLPSSSLATAATVPRGRVVTMNEATVPPKEGLPPHLPGLDNDLKLIYPGHTRVVHHVAEGLCTTGYAVTQAAARELLFWVGLTKVDEAYDRLLRQVCDGTNGQKYQNCLAANPSLFQPHRAAGSESTDSDIQQVGAGFREKGFTAGVRWSTRLNLDVLLAGGTEFEDSYPDEPKPEII